MKKGFDEEQDKENEVPAGPINLGDDDEVVEEVAAEEIATDEFALGEEVEEEEEDAPFGFGDSEEI